MRDYRGVTSRREIGNAESRPDTLSSEEQTMRSTNQGLPAAASVEQAIILAQLQILRQLDRQRNCR